jgi:hypothetical protein
MWAPMYKAVKTLRKEPKFTNSYKGEAQDLPGNSKYVSRRRRWGGLKKMEKVIVTFFWVIIQGTMTPND